MTYKSIFFGALVLGLSVSGCKKGEEDPFLSLKSRTARLAGDWKLVEGTMTETDEDGTYTTTISESQWVTTGPADYSNTQMINIDFTFDKNGTYVQTIVSTSDNLSSTSVNEGAWFWLGKNKEEELKKKEAIALVGQKSIEGDYQATNDGIDYSDNYIVKRLTNKEMVLVYEYKYSSQDIDWDGEPVSYRDDTYREMKFEKQ